MTRRAWFSRTWLAIGVLLTASGCWTNKEVGEKMQADIAALQTEFEVVKKAHAEQKAQLDQRLQEADKRIAELQQLIEEFRKATGRNAADIGVDLEKLKSQIMELRGQQEVSQHRIETIERRISGIRDDLAAKTAEAARTRDEEAKRKLEDAAKAKEAEKAKDPLAAIKRPEKQEEFYKLAYSLLESGQHEAARALFKEFLEKWPNSSFSDNALYWTGESYYAEKKFREAALSFQQTREKFPKGDKAPDALLKLGFCFMAMEMYKEALPFLKEFVQTYPKHPQVSKAKEKIQEAEKKLK